MSDQYEILMSHAYYQNPVENSFSHYLIYLGQRFLGAQLKEILTLIIPREDDPILTLNYLRTLNYQTQLPCIKNWDYPDP